VLQLAIYVYIQQNRHIPFAEELMTKFRITVKNGSIPALYENSCLRCMESMQVFRRLKRAEDC
jgi:hypothetical protein